MQETPERGLAVGPQIIFGLDSSGRCTLSTGLGLDSLRVRPGELVGQNLFVVYRDDEAAVEALRRVLAGQTFTVEREFHGRILAVYYEPVHNADGVVVGALGVSTDVTEQRRAERELRAARQRATLLGDIAAALTREVLDPDALIHLAVHSVADPVADSAVAWVRTPEGDDLEARAGWSRRGSEAPPEGQPPDLAAVQDLQAPQVLDDAGTRIRVPLCSRGMLLGVIDLTRSPHRGPVSDDDLGLATDIAERCALALDNALLLDGQRRAHEELVKFGALANASDNLVGISDAAGRLIYVNPRVREIGIVLSSDDVWAEVATYVGEATATDIRRGVEGEGRWSGDLRIFLPDEELIGQLDAFRLTHPETGAALGTGWIAKDVTGLRHTEAALRAANTDLKQFKALVDASPDFIAIADLDGTVRYVNPGGRELSGLDPDIDVTTTTISDYLTPEGIVASVEVEQPAVIAHGHWEGESTLRNHRGPPVPVAIASFLMRDAETGEPFALATVQRDISERLAAETTRRELAEQQQALLTRLVGAQEAERTRIAADVHDDPVQALAAVDLRLGLLNRRLRERAPELLETLEPLQASVSGATERLRALLFDLEPPDLQHGLSGALCRVAEEIFLGTETRWTVDGTDEPEVPNAVRAIAYRIAKESLNNVRKHADAHDVTVTVRGRDGGIEVSVVDDGVGLDPEAVESAPGHRGLLNMQDRAAIAGGWCSLTGRPEGGTVVTIWLPGTDLLPA